MLSRQQGEGVEEKTVENSKEQAIAKSPGWQLQGLSCPMHIITLPRKPNQALEGKKKKTWAGRSD